MSIVKRKSRSHISRKKKIYWRKGVNLEDVEDYLSAQRYDETTGGSISERKDEELFAINTTGKDEFFRLTHRQQAAMDKRQNETAADSKPSKRMVKKTLRNCQKRPPLKIKNSVKTDTSCANKEPWDLWKEEKVNKLAADQELLEKVAKTGLRKKPSTLNHIPSLLPIIEIPHAGVSYNPRCDIYKSYVKDIAEDQLKEEEKEKNINRNLGLSPGESFVTAAERFLEESAGLFNDVEDDDLEKSSGLEDVSFKETVQKKLVKRKTRKEIRRKLLQRKKQMEKARQQKLKSEEQMIFKISKMNKEISKNCAERERRAKVRRKSKALKKLVEPQGKRGKFIEVDKAFLLPEELPGSLRQLKPQASYTILGNIIVERLKSFQKRNILPLPGERKKRKLKKKLKFKKIERRSCKEVTVGSDLKF